MQLAAVAAAITDAPDEAKQVFEAAAADDMFSPALADYTRTDSTITQAERQLVVVVTAAGSVLALPRPSAFPDRDWETAVAPPPPPALAPFAQ